MKKMLFIATRNPYEICDGRSFSLNSYCKVLAKEYNLKVLFFADKHEKANEKLLKKPSFIEKIFNCFFLSIVLRLPLQVSAMYSRNSKRKINRVFRSFKPDYVICDMCRTAIYIKNINCLKILDMDDVLSERYYQAYINNEKKAIGQLENNLPKFVNKVISLFKLDKKINKFEYKAMRKYEIKLAQKFDAVILVSPLECSKFSQINNLNNVFCWPIVVDINSKDPCSYNKKVISFVGNMNVSHNLSTLKEIIENIMPNLQEDFVLRVVGNCSEAIKSEYEDKNVVFTGRVDSVEKNIEDTLAVIAPIKFGSGIKIKIVESMSYCVPVITTPKGIEGLDIENGVNILVANDYKPLSEYVIDLSKNDMKRNFISLEAKKYVEKNHNYSRLQESIEQTFNFLNERIQKS